MATVIITAAAMNVLLSLIVARDVFFELLHNFSNESFSSSPLKSLNNDRRTESSFFVIFSVAILWTLTDLKIFHTNSVQAMSNRFFFLATINSFAFDFTWNALSLDKTPNYLHWLGFVLIQSNKHINVVVKITDNFFFVQIAKKIVFHFRQTELCIRFTFDIKLYFQLCGDWIEKNRKITQIKFR